MMMMMMMMIMMLLWRPRNAYDNHHHPIYYHWQMTTINTEVKFTDQELPAKPSKWEGDGHQSHTSVQKQSACVAQLVRA